MKKNRMKKRCQSRITKYQSWQKTGCDENMIQISRQGQISSGCFDSSINVQYVFKDTSLIMTSYLLSKPSKLLGWNTEEAGAGLLLESRIVVCEVFGQ